ncbi:MAG: hypothetical protein MJ170_04045 [Alphaproteobacteria bacterium]|nr:hypothetical protein [Alphaproteobacteria bacterium]
MKKLSIIPIVCLCSGAAFGDIASTEYVNSEKSKLETTLSTKMDKGGYTASRAMQTSNTGSATSGKISGSMMADGAITTDKLANGSVDNNAIADGAIGLKKLSLTFPTSGKHLLTWDNASNSYKFEAIKLAGSRCPTGQYDIGFEQCVDPATVTVINSKYYALNATSIPSDNPYNFSTPGEWGVTFDGYGTVKGIASCNSTSGTSVGEVKPGNTFTQDSEGLYCWCKMTSPSASGWVFRNDSDDADICANNCASACANGVRRDSDFRPGVFGSVGN